MAVAVNPAGSISTTLTAAFVAAPPAFRTAIEYVLPFCPCAKLPVCVLVIVKSGTATEYEGNDPTCTPHVYQAPSTFVDAGEASGHLVRNESTTDNLVVIVVRLIPEALVPTQRIDKPNPGYCPNIN